MIHTLAWMAWLIAVLISLSATRNPLYLILILLCLAIVFLVLGRGRQNPKPLVSPLRFTLVVMALTSIFNTLTSHFGETVLFIIPGEIPLLSGVLTLEAFVYGAINGMVLSGFFAGFLILNRALPVRSLLRLVPRAFYPVAVVISIAVTYLPTTQRLFMQVREAQAIRGHRPGGIRGWFPLLMPLLVGGLERALALSEAMTARGFASTVKEIESSRPRIFILIGTLLLLTGWMMSMIRNDLNLITVILGMAGAGLLVYGFWTAGRQAPHTTYHQEAWKPGDSIVLIGALLVIVAYLFAGKITNGMDYNPYPVLSIPLFHPLIGIITLGLLTPSVSLPSV